MVRLDKVTQVEARLVGSKTLRRVVDGITGHNKTPEVLLGTPLSARLGLAGPNCPITTWPSKSLTGGVPSALGVFLVPSLKVESDIFSPVTTDNVQSNQSLDDHTDGKLIPQGSSIALNVWGMHHDSERWEEPEHTFQPKLFASLGVGLRGFERRDHLGAGRAGGSAFEFLEPPDSHNDIPARSGASRWFLHCLKDSGCAIRARSPEKRDTIMQEFGEAQEVFARAD
ncbi:Cytochrome P450 [Penicillium verrucosum]|uniref:Cytochrome P450 n=1 Tax=Penicillium verrucosum TaxID=60171 RepID=UPI002545AD6C|nr:Cytochrome P450 [Penicillium verrucosum]KAJ5942587.1 Cytochrome P450 [Penicillium verrucosum]